MIRASAALALAGLLALGGASAQPVSLRDSFAIGSGTGIVCTAQVAPTDAALSDMFDRGYSIVCRDAAGPVGRLYALRRRGGDPSARLAGLRGGAARCGEARQVEIEGLGTVEAVDCRESASGAGYRAYLIRRGNTLYAAEGLAGYDSALRLGLRSLVADRPVEGEVSVATTEAGDEAAFARAQAAALDPRRALEEAYRRNNAGAYAEASEFFASLSRAETPGAGQAEALLNQALQQSNLGGIGEAEALFERAAPLAGRDPVLARRLRNYRAMHLLNQLLADEALALLDAPLPRGAEIGGGTGSTAIDAETAARLSRETGASRRLDAAGNTLLPEEKARILDAQALHLRGTIHRIEGRGPEAERAFNGAVATVISVREGRVASVIWMRAQIESELAALAEARGDSSGAEARHRGAVALLAADYPGSAALLQAQARLAGFLARSGRAEPARALFREIVAQSRTGSSSPTLRRSLQPYFALLAAEGSDLAAAELFAATQLLVRPGVAQTQAVLARELGGGSDEAARLFRQSVSLTRDIERSRVEIARLEAEPAPDSARLATLRAALAQIERDQVATQSRLADFPRYRAVAGGPMTLAELQQQLRPGEAYYKMTVAADEAYAIYATHSSARAWRIDSGPAAIERDVDALRETIAVVEDNRTITYPFDVERAHALYRSLFGPVDSELAAVRHLIFEPDGAMLRLPPNLLVADSAGVEAYRRRASQSGSDGFDFTGIAWLGRERDVSTAVSARAFRDVRLAPASRAGKEYLGFGENAPADGFLRPPTAGARSSAACAWSLAAWNRPIPSDELFAASRAIAAGDASETEIVTGEAFNDSAIKGRGDLAEYRILHFATHGLTGAPRDDCPAQPALLTSFGPAESDGLLTFSEIFDLRIDADLVILSACDTAARAGVAATRAAGITSGGDYALDGLVRAFVGAGGRSVVASHWPVPDDFQATSRLISGLFDAPAGTSTAAALRQAQRSLMDDPETSHPYYWSGFAIVGDGARPVVPSAGAQASLRLRN
jgi:CHAT domain-containing protein